MTAHHNKKILLLGSTGSIGVSTCNCIRRFRDRFTISGLAAARSLEKLTLQIEEFKPQSVYVADHRIAAEVRARFGATLRIYDGTHGLEALVRETEFDILVNALVGAVGLRPTVAALQRNKRVALANKESLVIGGDYIRSLIDGGMGSLVPIDSEHSAILQCLSGSENSTIESIILTASGGPFRNLPIEHFTTVTPQQALRHPTWSMGRKITIDAATLMNKGFEVIEAHHLFRLPYDRLRVWIHPQSIIHSLVEFHDGAVMAQLGLPDMELPIQYALSFPQRLPMHGKRLSLPEIGRLEFYDPDLDRFPCLRLCLEAGRAGGTAPAVVNAANEVAVELFLEGKIAFNDIAQVVARALHLHVKVPAVSLEAIETADMETRKTIRAEFKEKGIT
jgi:1-deoxy-D-xylulose-5-phosphate reductoisomerase